MRDQSERKCVYEFRPLITIHATISGFPRRRAVEVAAPQGNGDRDDDSSHPGTRTRDGDDDYARTVGWGSGNERQGSDQHGAAMGRRRWRVRFCCRCGRDDRCGAFDLVLLDVQLSDGTGFDVVRAIGPEHMPAVIFIGAYVQYAVRAFEMNAVDYLLKPFGAINELTFAKTVSVRR